MKRECSCCKWGGKVYCRNAKGRYYGIPIYPFDKCRHFEQKGTMTYAEAMEELERELNEELEWLKTVSMDISSCEETERKVTALQMAIELLREKRGDVL